MGNSPQDEQSRLPIPPHQDLGAFFNVEKLLGLSDGAVVLDLSGMTDAFYVQAHNSRKFREIARQIALGDLIPINGDVLGDLTSNHALLNIYMYANDFPMIPTILNPQGIFPGDWDPQLLQRTPVDTIPGIYVHKKSGEGFSHGGKGITILDEKEKRKVEITLPPVKRFLYPTLENPGGETNEFIQKFILPPKDIDKRRYVRDIRIVNIDGKPITGIIRRAEEPLPVAIINGKMKPTEKHYPTASNPGVIEQIPPGVWEKVAPHAEAISALLERKVADISAKTGQLYSNMAQAGFLTTDFLEDANGNFFLTDTDVAPMIRPDIIPEVSIAFAGYLTKLARKEGRERRIVIIGDENRDLIQETIRKLTETGYPVNKITVQDLDVFHPLP